MHNILDKLKVTRRSEAAVQRANGLGTGLGVRYRVPQGRPGQLEEEVDKGPEGA
jgi:hypothetical protein